MNDLAILNFDKIKEIAGEMATAKITIPKHIQGQSGDCLAIAMQATQWGMNPYSVAQATSLINGTLAYSAQLVNAVISSSTAIDGHFHYEYSGPWKSDKDPDAWVRCGAILRGDDCITWGEPLYPAQQQTKNSPLWKSNPRQQGAYQALKFWARLYCPAVILGVHTPEEIKDQQRTERDVTPAPVSALRKPEEPKALSDEHQWFVDALKSATTLPDLKELGDDINRSELSGADMESLRVIFAEQSAIIQAEGKV